MSEEPAEHAEKAPAAPAGPKPPKIVLILLVLNLAASGFATFKLVTAKPAHAAKAEPTHEPTTAEISGPVVPLDSFVVNLDEPGPARYIKVTLQLELVNADGQKKIEQSKQVIRDAILSHLSGLKLADTLGASAKDKLRSEMMKKIEGIVGDHIVRRMFFQDFVVQ
jgi:flagellar protein FliL